MAPIIGERISAITVARLSADAYEWYYVEGISDPFKHIRIDCERHSFHLSYPTFTVMNNVEGLDPLDMTMGELKDAVSYYSDLFD